MASLNQVSIELQVKGEREATQALKRYSDASDRLNRSVLDAASKVESTTNAWNRANKLYEKGVLNAKALQAAQTQLARELAVTNGYLKSNGALNTQKALAELRAAQATQEAAAAEAKANAERQRASQSYRQLMASINPTVAAQQRLSQGVQAIRAAQRAGVITTQEAITSLRQLRAAQDAAAQGGQFASRGLNRMGVVAQQAGYQVGDFFVQIQSGTNAMVAFGQQATQLVGTFAMFARTTRAAIIASGIGIFVSIATAVGAAIMRMNGQMDTLDTKVQKMTSSFDDLNTSMDRLEDADLDQTFGDLTGEIESITEAMVSLNNAAALNNLMSTFEKLEGVADAGFFKNVEAGFKNLPGILLGPFFDYTTSEELDKEAFAKLGYDMSREQYLAYLDGLQKLASQGDVEGVTSLIATFFQDATDGAAQVSMEGMAIAQSMESAAIKSAEFAARQNGSAEATRLLSEELEALIEAERLIGEGTEEFLESQNEAREKAIKYNEKTNQSLNEQIALLRQQIDYGKESVSTKQLERQQAERAFEAELKSKNLSEDEIKDLMTKFGLVQSLTKELEKAEDAAYAIGSVNFSNIKDGATWAGELAKNLSAARAESLEESVGGNVDYFDPRGRIVGSPTAGRFGRGQPTGVIEPDEVGVSGGGAAGSADNLRQSVDRLIASYDEQYAKSLKVAEATKLMAEAQMAGAIPANMSADKILQDYIASLEDADDTMSQFVNDTASQMSDALMSIVDGSKSASDAFGDMARAILKQAFELAVINPIINSIFGGVSGFNPLPSLLGSANGNAFSDGRVVPFANGGVVSSPTIFPMRGAQTGLMGEAGPEAIMPLKRGKGGKLGVVAEGVSQPVVVHQNFNFQANGDESVKKIIAQVAPSIANMTKQSIMDARRRGGAMKSTFG